MSARARILTQGCPVPIALLIGHYIIETHSSDFIETQAQRLFDAYGENAVPIVDFTER
jgi:hypothetical protein